MTVEPRLKKDHAVMTINELRPITSTTLTKYDNMVGPSLAKSLGNISEKDIKQLH